MLLSRGFVRSGVEQCVTMAIVVRDCLLWISVGCRKEWSVGNLRGLTRISRMDGG